MNPSSDPRSDDELLRAVNQGDADAFEALYRRYRTWVVRLACRFTGDPDEALDVLQETFAYLLRKVPHLRLTAAMTTFLYPAVRNISLALKRKRRRQQTWPDPAPVQAAPEAGDFRLADLSAVVSGLPDGQREVLLLRFADGLELAEIAKALEIPVGTVKSRLHNAIAALRGDPRTRAYFEREA